MTAAEHLIKRLANWRAECEQANTIHGEQVTVEEYEKCIINAENFLYLFRLFFFPFFLALELDKSAQKEAQKGTVAHGEKN